jgi:3-phosphoshikimate 1-carboxyvinyltransferase
MTSIHVAPASSVQGEVHVPGDKSVSHRALLLALVSSRDVQLSNLAIGRDVEATIQAIEQLGAHVERGDDPTSLRVTGVGLHGIQPPADMTPIDCRNAGTLARLLPGLLAAQPAGRNFELVGDESLSARPMDRIAQPLAWMGAKVETTTGDRLPMRITSGGPLEGGEIELDVASAQVESAMLFAGLGATGTTTVIEPSVMRDHTERLLRRAGASITRRGNQVSVKYADSIELPDTTIANDPSSAAPFMVAATVLHGSMLRLPGIIDSPGRRGLLDTIEQMGGRVSVTGRRELDGEPIADVEVRHAALGRTFVEVEDVARMIDELPLIAVLAHFRRGEFVVRGAAELRVKESDRIASLELAMRRVGISVQPLPDGFIVRGSSARPSGGTMDAAGDHRLAMLGGVVGLASRQGVTIEGADCVDVSFPGFFDVIDAIAVR